MTESLEETQIFAVEQEDRAADQVYWKSPAMVELVGCIVFLILGVTPYLALENPRHRPIPFQLIQSGEYILNPVNNESFDSETISDLVLILVAVLLPVVLQAVLAKCVLKRPGDTHATICTYLVGFGLTMLATETIKHYVGYLRPSFYDLCEPTADYTACTAQDSDDARKSFLSGHASMAFCGLSLLSKYLERSFGIDSVTQVSADEDSNVVIRYKTKSPHFHRLFSILCLLPMASAIFIAASRVVDNKHFPADIVGGSVLGAACAQFAHRLWFPSLRA